MELDYPDSLTCTQLVKMITNPLNGEKHRKFEDIVDEYLSQIDEEERTKTYKLYRGLFHRSGTYRLYRFG